MLHALLKKHYLLTRQDLVLLLYLITVLLGTACAAEEEVPAHQAGPGPGVGAAVPALLVLGGLQPGAQGPPQARPGLQGPDQDGHQGD